VTPLSASRHDFAAPQGQTLGHGPLGEGRQAERVSKREALVADDLDEPAPVALSIELEEEDPLVHPEL
jgi:hypothetical protein